MILIGNKSYQVLMSGERGLRVSLPAEWVNKNGLEIGDTIYSRQADHGIIVVKDIPKSKSENTQGWMCYSLRVGNCITVPNTWGLKKGDRLWRYAADKNFKELVLSKNAELHLGEKNG